MELVCYITRLRSSNTKYERVALRRLVHVDCMDERTQKNIFKIKHRKGVRYMRLGRYRKKKKRTPITRRLLHDSRLFS